MAQPSSHPASGNPVSYQTNVNRAKTKKWAEAKVPDYGGDDWGDEDEDDYYAPPVDDAAPQQEQGPIQSAEQLSAKTYGDVASQAIPSTASRGRANSFDQNAERRDFSSAGVRQASQPLPKAAEPIPGMPATRFSQMGVPPSRALQNLPPLSTHSEVSSGQPMGKPEQASPIVESPMPMGRDQTMGPSTSETSQAPNSRSANQYSPMTSSSIYSQATQQSRANTNNTSQYQAYSPGAMAASQNRQDSFTAPLSSVRGQSATRTPLEDARTQVRKGSFGQAGAPGMDNIASPGRSPTSTNATLTKPPLPFVRPADIYRRAEEQKERERKSLDSGRPAMETLISQGGTEPEHAPTQRAIAPQRSNEDLSQGRYRSASVGREGSAMDSTWHGPQILEPVAERQSEYGFDGFDVNKVVPPSATTSVSPTTLQTLQKTRTHSTSPKIPDLKRMSDFGADMFTSLQSSGNAPVASAGAPPVADSVTSGSAPGSLSKSEASLGFQGVVKHAFSRNDSQTGSLASQSQDDMRRAASQSTGTTGISPIMSRAPSAAQPTTSVQQTARQYEERAAANMDTKSSSRPDMDREASFRPTLPGGWVSFAPSLGESTTAPKAPGPTQNDETSEDVDDQTPRNSSYGMTSGDVSKEASSLDMTSNSINPAMGTCADDQELPNPAALRRLSPETQLRPGTGQRAETNDSDRGPPPLPKDSPVVDAWSADEPPLVPLKTKQNPGAHGQQLVSPSAITRSSTNENLDPESLSEQIENSLSPRSANEANASAPMIPGPIEEERQSSLFPSEYDSYWASGSGNDQAERGSRPATATRNIQDPTSGDKAGSSGSPQPEAMRVDEGKPTDYLAWRPTVEKKMSWSENFGDTDSANHGDLKEGSEPTTSPNPNDHGRPDAAATALHPESKAAATVAASPALSEPVSLSATQYRPWTDENPFPHSPSLGTPQMPKHDEVSEPSTTPSSPVDMHHQVSEPAVSAPHAPQERPHVSGPLRQFKDITDLPLPHQRISAFNETREQYANMPDLLSGWLYAMKMHVAEHREASQVFAPGMPVTQGSISARGKLGRAVAAGPGTPQGAHQQHPAGITTSAARPSPSDATGGHHAAGGKLSTHQVQAKGKELLHSAGVFGGKAGKAGRGLLAKGKNKLRNAGGDKENTPEPDLASEQLPQQQQQQQQSTQQRRSSWGLKLALPLRSNAPTDIAVGQSASETPPRVRGGGGGEAPLTGLSEPLSPTNARADQIMLGGIDPLKQHKPQTTTTTTTTTSPLFASSSFHTRNASTASGLTQEALAAHNRTMENLTTTTTTAPPPPPRTPSAHSRDDDPLQQHDDLSPPAPISKEQPSWDPYDAAGIVEEENESDLSSPVKPPDFTSARELQRARQPGRDVLESEADEQDQEQDSHTKTDAYREYQPVTSESAIGRAISSRDKDGAGRTHAFKISSAGLAVDDSSSKHEEDAPPLKPATETATMSVLPSEPSSPTTSAIGSETAKTALAPPPPLPMSTSSSVGLPVRGGEDGASILNRMRGASLDLPKSLMIAGGAETSPRPDGPRSRGLSQSAEKSPPMNNDSGGGGGKSYIRHRGLGLDVTQEPSKDATAPVSPSTHDAGTLQSATFGRGTPAMTVMTATSAAEPSPRLSWHSPSLPGATDSPKQGSFKGLPPIRRTSAFGFGFGPRQPKERFPIDDSDEDGPAGSRSPGSTAPQSPNDDGRVHGNGEGTFGGLGLHMEEARPAANEEDSPHLPLALPIRPADSDRRASQLAQAAKHMWDPNVQHSQISNLPSRGRDSMPQTSTRVQVLSSSHADRATRSPVLNSYDEPPSSAQRYPELFRPDRQGDQVPADLPPDYYRRPISREEAMYSRQQGSEYEIEGVGPPEDPPVGTSSRRSSFIKEIGERIMRSTSLDRSNPISPLSPASPRLHHEDDDDPFDGVSPELGVDRQKRSSTLPPARFADESRSSRPRSFFGGLGRGDGTHDGPSPDSNAARARPRPSQDMLRAYSSTNADNDIRKSVIGIPSEPQRLARAATATPNVPAESKKNRFSNLRGFFARSQAQQQTSGSGDGNGGIKTVTPTRPHDRQPLETPPGSERAARMDGSSSSQTKRLREKFEKLSASSNRSSPQGKPRSRSRRPSVSGMISDFLGRITGQEESERGEHAVTSAGLDESPSSVDQRRKMQSTQPSSRREFHDHQVQPHYGSTGRESHSYSFRPSRRSQSQQRDASSQGPMPISEPRYESVPIPGGYSLVRAQGGYTVPTDYDPRGIHGSANSSTFRRDDQQRQSAWETSRSSSNFDPAGMSGGRKRSLSHGQHLSTSERLLRSSHMRKLSSEDVIARSPARVPVDQQTPYQLALPGGSRVETVADGTDQREGNGQRDRARTASPSGRQDMGDSKNNDDAVDETQTPSSSKLVTVSEPQSRRRPSDTGRDHGASDVSNHVPGSRVDAGRQPDFTKGTTNEPSTSNDAKHLARGRAESQQSIVSDVSGLSSPQEKEPKDQHDPAHPSEAVSQRDANLPISVTGPSTISLVVAANFPDLHPSTSRQRSRSTLRSDAARQYDYVPEQRSTPSPARRGSLSEKSQHSRTHTPKDVAVTTQLSETHALADQRENKGHDTSSLRSNSTAEDARAPFTSTPISAKPPQLASTRPLSLELSQITDFMSEHGDSRATSDLSSTQLSVPAGTDLVTERQLNEKASTAELRASRPETQEQEARKSHDGGHENDKTIGLPGSVATSFARPVTSGSDSSSRYRKETRVDMPGAFPSSRQESQVVVPTVATLTAGSAQASRPSTAGEVATNESRQSLEQSHSQSHSQSQSQSQTQNQSRNQSRNQSHNQSRNQSRNHSRSQSRGRDRNRDSDTPPRSEHAITTTTTTTTTTAAAAVPVEKARFMANGVPISEGLEVRREEGLEVYELPEEERQMSATSYPGMEWNPYGE